MASKFPKASIRNLLTVTSLLILLPPAALPTRSRSSSNQETTNLQRLSRAHLEFALSLFRTVAREASGPQENVLLSPYSVASVCSQLWLGTEPGSPSYTELERLLHYKDGGLGPEKVHRVFQSSLDTVDDPDFANVVKQGNALFTQEGVQIQPSYRRDLSTFYNSSLEEVDFSRGDATERVNQWVSERTGGLIPSLIDGPLPSNTRLLLVNALALRAFWKNSFDPTRTAANGIFHQGPNLKLELPMMAGKFKVLLGKSGSLRTRLLELPFRGKRLSMFILLPDEDPPTLASSSQSTLSQLEKNLTAHNLKKLFASLKEETVHIRMPRFSLEQSSRLTESLRSLGLETVFSPSQANFSRISTTEQLGVSTLAHKVTLEITEKGATAAAATAAGIERFGEVGEFFEINRPFLFFIWDYHSGALLFIGRVANPNPIPV